MAQSWNSGLCCPTDGQCLYSHCCTPCSISSARTSFDSSNCCFNLLCLSSPMAYQVVREGYGIEGDCCTDILIAGCLPCCAAMRLHAEVSARGPLKKGMN